MWRQVWGRGWRIFLSLLAKSNQLHCVCVRARVRTRVDCAHRGQLGPFSMSKLHADHWDGSGRLVQTQLDAVHNALRGWAAERDTLRCNP